MTTSNDPDEIRAEIERTRAELSYNVDTLTDTANPKHIAQRQVDKVKDAARAVRDRVMGSPEDDADAGRLGEARAAASDGARAVGDAVSQAPAKAKDAARGNPLAAGLIAFGVGLLIASAFPASRKEQRAVGELQHSLEPLRQQATDVVKEVADALRGPAEEAVEAVKSTATEAAANVQDQARSAADDVRTDAQRAKDAVQDSTSR